MKMILKIMKKMTRKQMKGNGKPSMTILMRSARFVLTASLIKTLELQRAVIMSSVWIASWNGVGYVKKELKRFQGGSVVSFPAFHLCGPGFESHWIWF